MLVAIDTSNDYSGLALWNEAGLRAEATWFAGRRHTEQVLPQLDMLLRHLDLTPHALSVVAVATGPGSWSGLRAGMSLAKALALAGSLPFIGIPTLHALAHGQRGRIGPILSLVRLGRERYATALDDELGASWERPPAYAVVAPPEAPGLMRDPLVIGDLPASLQADAGVRRAPSPDHQRRAAHVAALAWERHLRDDHDDLASLEPIYLASPVMGA